MKSSPGSWRKLGLARGTSGHPLSPPPSGSVNHGLQDRRCPLFCLKGRLKSGFDVVVACETIGTDSCASTFEGSWFSCYLLQNIHLIIVLVKLTHTHTHTLCNVVGTRPTVCLYFGVIYQSAGHVGYRLGCTLQRQ